MNETHIQKDCWDKFSIIANFLALLIVPMVVGYYGSLINTTLKEKEIKVKYIEIAVDILSEKPSSDSKALRNWAINMLVRYSPLDIKDEAITELKRTALPRKNYLLDETGEIITDEKGNPILSE
jgi:hypothetical protein